MLLGEIASARWTERADGDLKRQAADTSPSGLPLRPWASARQVHGSRVLVVDHGGPRPADASEADALVTTRPGVGLCIRTADCAPLAFGSPQGVVGVAHAGWRGLAAGVIQSTLDWMRSLGAVEIEAGLGPCIGPECYEFGGDDLDRLAAAFGSTVRAQTSTGAPALDLRAGICEVLDRESVPLKHVDPRCTACEAATLWSHRARGDRPRQGVVAWLN